MVWSARIESAAARVRATFGPGEVVGCAVAEIDDFERRFGRRLPSAYRLFLATMGARLGEVLVGSDFVFADVENAREAARWLLVDEAMPALPTDAFVFCAHQGYQFLYFRTFDDDPDPCVYYYLEGAYEYREVAKAFSAWLEATVEEECLRAVAEHAAKACTTQPPTPNPSSVR